MHFGGGGGGGKRSRKVITNHHSNSITINREYHKIMVILIAMYSEMCP